MRSILKAFTLLFVISATSAGLACAQQTAKRAPAAADISASDIQSKLSEGPPLPGVGQPNIRVVDAGGYHVAIGAIRRTPTPPGVAAKHYKVTEVYHVIEGSATLVTGGTMVNPKVRPADSIAVTQEDGPGESGSGIDGGVSRRIKAGDVVVIPAGTPHWFSAIDGSISYIVVRYDPGRVLTLK